MVKYEVYKQDNTVDKEKVTRFHTKNKLTAFMFMDEKNTIENRNIWRVAICVSKHVCFDIDESSEDNLINILNYYENMFGYQFRVIKTNSGYHLISTKKYENKEKWLYDECRILYPLLSISNLSEYIQKVKLFYREQAKRERKDGISKDNFLTELSNEFKKSELYMGKGNFDILFSINVLFREYHCMRISRKSKEDKPREITINRNKIV
jgi:hypothetical protein